MSNFYNEVAGSSSAIASQPSFDRVLEGREGYGEGVTMKESRWMFQSTLCIVDTDSIFWEFRDYRSEITGVIGDNHVAKGRICCYI